jgi:hypothetical protein
MALAFGITTVGAQSPGENNPFGTSSVSVGISWSAPISFGSSDASLTTPSGAPFRLFSASSRVSEAPGLDLRIDRKIVRAVDAELVLGYSSPSLTTHLSTDAEGAAAADASESLRELVVGGGALIHPSGWRIKDRAFPFLSAGGGYVRQLHQDRVLVESGGVFWFGGGAVVPWRTDNGGRSSSRFGLRFDARMIGLSASVLLDRRRHLTPAVGASVFTRF